MQQVQQMCRGIFGMMSLCALILSVTAQTPTIYGSPQTVYNVQDWTPNALTLNLPQGGSPVPTPVIYIIQAAMRLAPGPGFDTPAGFSAFCPLHVDANEEEQIFYAVFQTGTTPPTSVSLNASDGYSWAGAIAVAYQGINPATPFDGGNCSTGSGTGPSATPVPNTNPTSVTAPAYTTSVPNDLVLWSFFSSGDVGTSGVAVAQGTTRAEVTRTELQGDGYLNLSELPLTNAGASGDNTASWQPTGWGVVSTGAIAMALAPAGSSPAEPPPIMVSSLAPNVGDTTSPVPQAPGYAPIVGLNESVSPENGSVSFGFQMPLPPGRQLTPGFSVSYNSAGAHYIASSSTTAANYVTENGVLASAGWSYSVPMLTFSASRVTPPGTDARCEVSSSYVYQSADGQRIPLQLTVAGFQWGADNASNACGSQYYPQVTQDHEGAWRAQTQPDGTWWDYQPVTVFDPQGNTILFSGTAGFSNASVPQSITDRNGNIVNYAITTAGALTITDTLGRKITTNGFGQLSGDSISVPGMNNQFSVVWGNESGSAVSNITGVGSSPCSTTTATMGSGKAVTSITGPQGTYTFSYDPTFGLVDKITYPNGGYVRYVWGTNGESDEAQLTQFQNGAYSTCTARVDTRQLLIATSAPTERPRPSTSISPIPPPGTPITLPFGTARPRS